VEKDTHFMLVLMPKTVCYSIANKHNLATIL